MDSGTSGSMQSSSGGDEEYESRSESMSAFLNSSQISPVILSQQQQPPPPSSSLFDPLSNYLDTFSRSPPSAHNPLLNLDMMWARGPSAPTAGAPIGSSSSPVPSGGGGPFATNVVSPMQLPGPASQPNPVRNPKKRSRASRRAPTTVLTTDTTNFRAMVQEFTGIPAPPFAASPFSRSRLDLFGTASSSPPPYLLRPFAHKVQPSSFSPSSSVLDVLSSSTASLNSLIPTTNSPNPTATNRANFIGATITNPTSTNAYQLLTASDLNISKQRHNQFNMESQQLFTFQPLLQPPAPLKYPLANFPIPGLDKPQGPSTISTSTEPHLKTGSMLNELALDRGRVSNISSLLPPDGAPMRTEDAITWSEVAGSGGGEQGQPRQYNGSSSCKMNFSTSSSDFHADKTSENVSSRGEGMVDSWICSSDS